ncbi:hypothetical protein [Flavobacterium seoulense]|uniref:DoxX family protein n=1 Tax=Flavobacterium seoulense TaxID=1492738 RepID=A0A066WTK9_9FLAO|nr:hypothetical protein [Flavobacterium seoulense]KDN55893.1 hypothetical protein FEM21_10840 [Flavobacterium seoulense]
MEIKQNIESVSSHSGSPIWSKLEKISFRFAFIFFLLLIVPLQSKWYERLFEIDSFYDLLSILSGSRTGFIEIESESGKWGAASYASWGIALLIAGIGTAIWTIISRNSKRQQYNELYYWLRVIVRYRIAVGLIAFGYIKFFPMQMPFPSVSNLNTDLGDYASFKLYWQVVGLSVWYQIFLGALEIVAGILLFFRATTALGAIITAGVLYNIAHANLAYDGAVHVYSSYFVLLSLFLLVQYAPNIWKLLVKKQSITPNYYYPKLKDRNKKIVFYSVKYAFIFSFVFIYGYYRYNLHYNEGRLKEPVVPGLANAEGYYSVSSFTINGDTLAYSPLDSIRWNDAVFERYSTLVFKVDKALDINLANGGPTTADLFKDYEFTGRSGGKTYLYYETDSINKTLYLVNKNQEFSKKFIKKFDKKDNEINLKKLYTTTYRDSIGILKWKYDRPQKNRIVLSGKDHEKNSIQVVLDKLDRKYTVGKEWHSEIHKYVY